LTTTTLRNRIGPSCYPEGVRLGRSFVVNDPDRYGRLLREPLIPSDLLPATAPEGPRVSLAGPLSLR
jgi:hypothetical protein